MCNWENEVHRLLASGKFSAEECGDISRELAGYLEDLYNAARVRGLDDSAAVAKALKDIREDPRLGARLRRARKEKTMNDRTKQLWLPGLTILLVSVALLVTLKASGFSHFVFGRMMLHTPAPAEAATRAVMRLVLYRDASLLTYCVWLLGLQFLGAAGACWSRRAGSGRTLQIASGLFPLILFVAVAVSEQLAAGSGMLGSNAFFLFAGGAGPFLSWVIIPGAALMLGVLPFARGSDEACHIS